jgi:hypothetical protein
MDALSFSDNQANRMLWKGRELAIAQYTSQLSEGKCRQVVKVIRDSILFCARYNLTCNCNNKFVGKYNQILPIISMNKSVKTKL